MCLTAQFYCKSKNVLGTLITALKALTSRACELASVYEMEIVLRTKDAEFVQIARNFILNLWKVGEIKPFRRAWVPLSGELKGFITSMDGGSLGFGSTTHSRVKVPNRKS